MADRLDAQLRALAHALVDEAPLPPAFDEFELEPHRSPAPQRPVSVPAFSTATADELVHRRVTRRVPMVATIAVGLAVALVVGGALLLSKTNDSSSVHTPAGLPAAGAAGGCAGKAYVTGGDGVSVITTATGKVSPPIHVGGNPFGVAITPDGTHAYVTNFVANGVDSTVSVIDTATGVVSPPITVGKVPAGVAITPDGTRAYVTNNDGSTVSVIDTATGVVSASIDVGGFPYGVAITPDGTRAYVASVVGTVSVIDTATGVVSARITIAGASGVAFTPDGTHAYVTSAFGETVSVIDTATGVVSAPITLGAADRPIGSGGAGARAIAVAITPDGTHAYVTSGWGDTVWVIDTATGVVSARITVGEGPTGVAFTPDGTHAYVTSGGDGTVSVIDTATGVVSARITIAGASGVAICPAISVAQARRDHVAGPVLVNGYLLVTANGRVRICAGLRSTRPPRCKAPSLTVRGLLRRDLDDLARRGRHRRTRWSPDAVQILGAVHGDVLRVSENAPA